MKRLNKIYKLLFSTEINIDYRNAKYSIVVI